MRYYCNVTSGQVLIKPLLGGCTLDVILNNLSCFRYFKTVSDMCKQPWLSRRATLTYQTTIYHTTQCRAPPVLLPPACYGPGPPGATAARLLLPKPLQAAALILIRQYVIHVHNATCQYAAVQVARQGGVVGLCDLSAGHEACLQHPPWQVQNLI